MGGYGSGRPASRVSMEALRRLDVRELRQRGALASGHSGGWYWSQDGEATGSIGYRTFDTAITLDYSISAGSDDRETVQVNVPLENLPCRFGGSRTYFRCPRCYRRCEVIAMTSSGRAWGCRKCLRLRYHSQTLSPTYRMQRRADELYARAGEEHEDGHVAKHKWLRWRTFDRLMDRANRLSRAADYGFLCRMRRLGFADFEEAQRAALGDSCST